MKNFKKITLIAFLGLSTVSFSGPTEKDAQVVRKHRYSFGNIDVARELTFSVPQSTLKNKSEVYQVVTGIGEVAKIYKEAEQKAHEAGLKEDEDTQDDDYKEAYEKTYNKYVRDHILNIGGSKVDCNTVVLKMVEDMITHKVNRAVQVKEEDNQRKSYAARYYTDINDVLERALILKNLKDIRISRGEKSGYKCTPVETAKETILCGRLEITYAPVNPEKGPFKGLSIGVVDSGDWRKHIEPQNFKVKTTRFSDVESFENFKFMNQVAACGLGEVQKSLVDAKGNHSGDLGLSDTLERFKREELRRLRSPKKANQQNDYDRFLADPENADIGSDYDDSSEDVSGQSAR